jgi:hypothetical protein
MIKLLVSYIYLYIRYVFFCKLERMSRIARFRTFCRYLLTITRTKITDLNFFETYSFGKNVDQDTRLRLGRLTTRLYLCLYIICLTILVLYTSIHQRTLRTQIHNPSLLVAQQLQEKYIDTVECSCTRASTSIDELVSIQPHFHQVSEIDHRILSFLQ